MIPTFSMSQKSVVKVRITAMCFATAGDWRDVGRRYRDAAMKDILLKIATHPQPIRTALARKVINKLSLFSYRDRLSIGAVDRPHYGHCIFQAARLAQSLKYPKISVIEFGCGGGNGLLSADAHITEVMKIIPVDIELYGFDNGTGLPPPEDYRDMPYYFKHGLYKMDRQPLERKVKRAKLVIGDVKDTCATFFDEYNPAPIGSIFYDLDFYSSTRAGLTLLKAESSHFLPRVFMYFDDIIGNNETWLCNDFTGERLAIKEFNRENELKKISKDYYLPCKHPLEWWPDHMYVYHDFAHPKYNDFVATKEQKQHEDAIKLK